MAYVRPLSVNAALVPVPVLVVGHPGHPESCRWLWEALRNLNVDIVVSKLVPHDWDWNQVHPVHGTPLMSVVNEGIRLHSNTFDEAPVWRLLRCCLSQGADPRKEAMGVTGTSCGWGGDGGKFPRVEPVKHAGHSAISLVFAVLAACMSYEKEYAAQIRNAHKMLHVLAEFVPRGEGSRIPVQEAVVDTWESVLRDEGRGDVELKVAGTNGAGAGSVRAHSLILANASAVLDASLASPMREGQTGVIHVEGTSVEAVRFLLQLVYAGSTCEEPEVAVLLGALDLAHRWQIPHVVAMAERALADQVSVENLGELCEAALLKDLPVLRAACRCLAGASSEAQAALDRGDYGPAVFGELRGVQMQPVVAVGASSGCTAPPPQKRRRTL